MQKLSKIISKIYHPDQESPVDVYIARNLAQVSKCPNFIQIQWSNYQDDPTLIQTIEHKSLLDGHGELLVGEQARQQNLEDQRQQHRKIFVFYQGHYYNVAFQSAPKHFLAVKKLVNLFFIDILKLHPISQYNKPFPFKIQQIQEPIKVNLLISLMYRSGEQFLPFSNVHARRRIKSQITKDRKEHTVLKEEENPMIQINQASQRRGEMGNTDNMPKANDNVMIPEEQENIQH